MKVNWLLIRGLGREAAHWHGFAQMLKALPSSGEVLCLDLPGAGSEYQRKGSWCVEDYSEDLRRRFLPGGGDEGCWGVVAISFGAMVALDWSTRYTRDFSRVVLINTSERQHSTLLQRLRPGGALEFLKIFSTRGLVQREKRIMKLTTQMLQDPQKTLKHWTEIASLRPVRRETLVRQITAAARFSLHGSPQCPVLFLASGADRIAQAACSQQLARALGAEYHLHPSAGHDLPLDDPQWVCDRVEEFVRRSAKDL